MNIFVLDNNISECAKAHCDKHVVKMLVEYCQLLCSAYYFTGEEHKSPYKLTHKNHPCAVWTRKSLSNWRWLKELGIELHKEYAHRYGKQHASGVVIESLEEPFLEDCGMTSFAQAMPVAFYELDAVTAYRRYYIVDKSNLLKYTKREVPSWIG